MVKYYVVAKKYDRRLEKQILYIAGEFDSFVLAEIFRDTYNTHYSADAQIFDGINLLNTGVEIW